jgi:hypothetical protein
MLARLLLVLAAGCTTPSRGATPAAPVDNSLADPAPPDRRLADTRPAFHELTDKEPVRDDVDATTTFTSADRGLTAGNHAYDAGDLPLAAALYRTVLASFPYSRYALAAGYNLALIAERNGDVDAAVRGYVAVYETSDSLQISIDGMLRAAALRARDAAWAQAEELLGVLAARTDLAPEVRREVDARLDLVRNR